MLGAFSLVPMIGVAAVVLELGQGYEARITTQSVADAAALAAANAYTASPTDTVLIASAGETASANGVAPSTITVTHLTNYSAAVSDAVQVVVSRPVPVYFGRIFSSQPSYTVSSTAVAALSNKAAPPCVIALASNNITGFSQLAGHTLSAPQCAVQSNSGITLTAGARTTAKLATASGTIAVSGFSTLTADNIVYGGSSIALLGTMTGTQIQKANSVVDPLAGNTGLAAARALLGTAAAPAAPSVATGTDLTLSSFTATLAVQGNTGTLSNGVWTLPAGTYNFRNLSVSGTKLVIQGPSTVTVSGTTFVGFGGGLTIGNGPVTIRGLMTISAGTVNLGAGRHYTGPITAGGGAKLTIGAGDLDVNGVMSIGDPTTVVTLGAGDTTIGNDGVVTAINLMSGATLTFSDGDFSANGNIVTSGGATLTFGATANHVIDGLLSVGGTTNFGAGTYVIDGLFTNNAFGTMTGSNVSFVLSGPLNATYGTAITLGAPTTASGPGIRDILFATSSILPTMMGGGAQDNFSGAVYSPNTSFMMTGGSSSSGSCFMIVAQTVLLSIGSTPAASCLSLGAATGNVTLLR